MLYNKYIHDLIRVRNEQRQFYSFLNLPKEDGSKDYRVFFDDIESEVTYLLIREKRPNRVLECAPCCGWSTSWILQALRDNNNGILESFDLLPDVNKYLLDTDLRKRFKFTQGDVRDNLKDTNYDYVFWDSEHNDIKFIDWYLNYISSLPKGTPVSIHDIFSEEFLKDNSPEIFKVLDWLRINKIQPLTFGFYNADFEKSQIIPNYHRKMIDELRAILIREPYIHPYIRNSCIFFER